MERCPCVSSFSIYVPGRRNSYPHPLGTLKSVADPYARDCTISPTLVAVSPVLAPINSPCQRHSVNSCELQCERGLATASRPQVVAHHGGSQAIEVGHHDTPLYAPCDLVDKPCQARVAA